MSLKFFGRATNALVRAKKIALQSVCALGLALAVSSVWA